MLVAAGFFLTSCSDDNNQQNPAPTVVTLSPANNAIGVAADTNLVITFSEAVVAEKGWVTIKRSSDNETVEVIDVPSDQVTGYGTNTITINPLSDLTKETGYYVLISDTAFDDEAGRFFKGINDVKAWNFTTLKLIAGYTYYRPDDEDLQLFKDAITNGYTLINVCFACLNADGSITFDNPEWHQNISKAAYQYAVENNIKVYLAFGGEAGCSFVVNTDNNPEDLILNYLNNLCDNDGICYDGVNLDLEGTQIQKQTDQTSLDNIVKIGNKLRNNGYEIVIAPEYPYVIPVTSIGEWKHDPQIYPQNKPNIYRTLLQKNLVDYVFVQLYNQPGKDISPGAESYICKDSLDCTAQSPNEYFVYENDSGFVKAFQTNMIAYWKDSIELTDKLVSGFPASDGAYGNGSYWAGMDYAPEIVEELKTISPAPIGVAVWAILNDENTDGLNGQWHKLDGTKYAKGSWDFVKEIKKW